MTDSHPETDPRTWQDALREIDLLTGSTRQTSHLRSRVTTSAAAAACKAYGFEVSQLHSDGSLTGETRADQQACIQAIVSAVDMMFDYIRPDLERCIEILKHGRVPDPAKVAYIVRGGWERTEMLGRICVNHIHKHKKCDKTAILAEFHGRLEADKTSPGFGLQKPRERGLER